jgi:hypothetical protein
MVHVKIDKWRHFGQKNVFIFPLILFIETLLCYGTTGFFCGFYWDDWPPLLLSNIAKANIFWTAYGDRPFSSWTFSVMFPILHDSAWAWQLATMAFRWMGVYLFYLVLVNLFPKQRALFQWASLLAIVLPVFQYQYISVAFSQHFLTYAIFAASLFCLVLSCKYSRYFWLFYPLSLLLAAAHMFMMEYFVGLEILRPLVLYLSMKKYSGSNAHRLGKTLILYLPFVIILGGYFYWRFIVFPQVSQVGTGFSNTPFLFYDLLSNPPGTLISLLTTIIADLRFTFLSSWLDRLWPSDLYLTSKVLWLSILLGVVGTGMFFLFFGEKEENIARLKSSEFFENIILGFIIFVFGIGPVWVTLRQVSEGKFSERFALAAIPGIALIFVTVIWKAAKSARNRYLFISILTILSMSYQVQMGNQMTKDYNSQKNFYSQLKWRIPELEPDTALYSPGIPTDYEADYSYSMGINLLYSTTIADNLHYWFFTPRNYTISTLLNDPNANLLGKIRGPEFSGKASNMVAIYQDGSECLLVLDPIYAAMTLKVDQYTDFGKLTNFDRIVDNGTATTTFPQALGTISNNNWCYYFEKADLARQEKNWQQVMSIYDQAKQKGFTPGHSIEYIPLINALAEQGEVAVALQKTSEAIQFSATVTPSACKLWSNLMQEHPNISSIQITQALGQGTCNFN